MRDPPLILAVDDTPENLEILQLRLAANGYEVVTAADGDEGLAAAHLHRPDLILLDIMMPKRDGISVVRELKSDPGLKAIPVILVTARSDTRDVVAGLDAGGDDYLVKPFEHAALLARVRSMLRQKSMHDTIQDQSERLASWNRTLEERVSAQVAEMERYNRLRRFLPEQIANLVMGTEDEADLLRSHRRDVTVVFCDLRGFTAFAEIAEPEEVMGVLAEYHASVGRLIHDHGGTLERFMGDGLLVVFNDPIPQDDHTSRALRMAIDMRGAVAELSERWLCNGHSLGFGLGISRGHATIGEIGFDRRTDYSVIGSVPNLAARLCAKATHGQILASSKVFSSMNDAFDAKLLGEFEFKGFHRPMTTYEILGVRT
jgi:adenylate cyclase